MFALKLTFMDQNRLKTNIEFWVALIEIAHRITYIYMDFGSNSSERLRVSTPDD